MARLGLSNLKNDDFTVIVSQKLKGKGIVALTQIDKSLEFWLSLNFRNILLRNKKFHSFIK